MQRFSCKKDKMEESLNSENKLLINSYKELVNAEKTVDSETFRLLNTAPKCLVKATRKICECKNNCVRSLIRNRNYFGKKCSCYDIKNLFSIEYIDCSNTYSKLKSMMSDQDNAFEVSIYNNYNEQGFIEGGFRDAVQDFCNGKLKLNEFKCFMESMRDECTNMPLVIIILSKFHKIKCNRGKLKKAIKIIKDILNIKDDSYGNPSYLGILWDNENIRTDYIDPDAEWIHDI